MSEVLSRAEIIIDVKESVARDIERVRAEVATGLKRIDREEASIPLHADLKPLRAEVKKAEGYIEQWEHKRATATLDIDRKKADAKLKDWQNRLEKANNQIDADFRKHARKQDNEASKLFVNQVRRLETLDKQRTALTNKQVRVTEQGNAKILRAEQNLTTALQREADKRARDAEASANRAERAADQVAKAAERASIKSTRARQKENVELDKLSDNVGRLQNEYKKLTNQLDGVHRAQQRLFQHPQDVQLLGAKEGDIVKRMEKVRKELQRVGSTPIDFTPDRDKSGRGLFNLLSAITQTTVRLGPFTTSIGGAVRVMGVLGPMIFQIVGALGALVAGAGAATIGLAGLAGAMGTGFVFAAAGIGFTLKSLMGDFKNIKSASDAYHKAVLNYGEGSEQAAKKLKIFNSTLKGASPASREAFLNLGKMSDKWKSMVTDQVRPKFLETMAEGIRTVDTMMPMLAKNTKTAFTAVSDGLQGWMRGLRSAEGQGVIDKIFGGFNRAIPNLMHGLGQLGAALGRVFASFSRDEHLGQVLRDFDSWGTRMNNAASRTGQLDSSVDKFMTTTRSMGRLLKSTGELLFNFFNVGQGAGASGFDRLTETIDHMNETLESPEGAKNFDKWMRSAVDTAFTLIGSLKPLVGTFVALSSAMQPVTHAIAEIIRHLANLLSAINQIPGGTAVLTGAFLIFMGGRLASGIFNAVKGLQMLKAAMLGITGAKMGTSILTGLFGQAAGGALAGKLFKTAAATKAVGAAAPVAAGQMALFGAEAAAAGGGAAGLGAGAAAGEGALAALGITSLGTAAAATGIGLAAVAAGYGIYKLSTHVGNNEKKMQSARKAADAYGRAAQAAGRRATAAVDDIANAEQGIVSSKSQLDDARQGLRDAEARRKGLKAGSQAYRDATADILAARMNYNQTQAMLDDAEFDRAEKYRQMREDNARQIKNTDKALAKAREAAKRSGSKDISGGLGGALSTDHLRDSDIAKETMKTAKKYNMSLSEAFKKVVKDDPKKWLFKKGDQTKAMQEHISDLARVHKLEQQQEREHQQRLLNEVNIARKKQGMAAIRDRNAFKGLDKETSVKIGVKFKDAQQATRVGQAASKAAQAGVGKGAILKVTASSKSAEAAVRRLNTLRIGTKVLTIVEKGGRKAISVVEQIIGRKLTKKEQVIISKGGPAAKAMIAKLNGMSLKELVQLLKGDDRDARAKVARAQRQKINAITQAIMRQIFNPAGLFANLAAIFQPVIRKAQGATGGAFASGGDARTSPGSPNASDAARIRNLDKRLINQSYTPTKGERVGSTRYIAGETSRAEFVISTNPAYKQRNKKLVEQAAGALGGGVTFAAAGIASAAANKRTPAPAKAKPPAQDFSKAGYYAPLGVSDYSAKKAPAFSAKRMKGKKFNSFVSSVQSGKSKVRNVPGNPYIGRVTALETQQSDLERELQLRQQELVEPEDYITETKNADGTSTYSFDSAAWESYKKSVTDQILPVYASLMAVVTELRETVAKAMARNRQLLAQANFNKRVLKKAYDIESARKIPAKAKEAAKTHEKRLDKLRDAKSATDERISGLKSSQAELPAKDKEAGFDYRGYALDVRDIYADIAKDKTDAQESAAQSNASGGDSGGGGEGGGGTTGSDAPTRGEQTFGYNSAINELRSQFQGNYGGVNTSGAAGRKSSGMQSNAASFGTPMGGSIAGGNPAKLNGASSAFSSSNAASGMLGGSSPARSAVEAAGGSTGASVAGGGGTTVNIEQNFAAPPPDPHTFGQNVAFELNAAL